MTTDFKIALTALGALLLLLLGALWFTSAYELVPERYYAGESAAARSNRLLAAERLVTRLGARGKSLATLHEADGELPAPPATVVLLGARDTLAASRVIELLRWVEGGGHLVVETSPTSPQHPDAILAGVGIEPVMLRGEDEAEAPEGALPTAEERREAASADGDGDGEGEAGLDADAEADPENVDEDEFLFGDPEEDEARHDEDSEHAADSHDESDSESDTASTEVPIRAPTVVILPGSDHSLRADMNGFPEVRFTKGAPLFSVSGNNAAALLQIAHGGGRLTAISDASFLTNEAIVNLDHGELVWHLTAGRLAMNAAQPGAATVGPPALGPEVWFIFGHDVPPIVALIWRYGYRVVLSFALFLAAVLWRRGTRFGPLSPPSEPPRRSLLEHVVAGGGFLWRQEHARTLLASVQRAARTRLNRRHPGVMRLADPAQRELVAKLAKVQPGEAGALFAPPSATAPQEFFEWVRVIERIRRAL